MTKPNRMQRQLSALQNLPGPLRRRATTFALGRVVPFLSTSGVHFEELTPDTVRVRIANHKKAQNHIGGVHAAAMALLAETATGFVLGMNIPDDKLPLIKSMHIDYVRRSEGAMQATAHFPAEARVRVARDPKGEVTIPVTVTDDSGHAPIEATMVWAWRSKR